ncbi:sensor histidine kinase [Enterovirga sp.]|uniref:sensor histidine kinase n=1 Tax=Enterovirga sp. TaxID=2026350 RepID=UPI002C0E3361|nr:sensor histidine kinase [Enterovirga sp.]HMO29934.1 sensor histidine kinase [Enterovirga sp.]
MSGSETYSIRARLLGRLMPAFLVLGLGLFYYLHAQAQRAAERSFDHLLAASALSIADAVQYDDGAPTVELPYSSHAILASRTSGRVFYRVTAPNGSLITGYPDLAAHLPLAASSTPLFSDGVFLDAPVRICTVGRFISGGPQSGWVTIVVAETNEDEQQFSAELLRLSFGPAAGIMLLATILVWLAVTSALRPLDAIERAIAANDAADLRRLDIPVPQEIHHLVAALNALIGRLKTLLSRMQNFIADSAHQIRTPLSNLRAQVEMAADEADRGSIRDQLRSIHRNAVVVSRLADQLLADTMVAHRLEVSSLVPTDLLELVELAVDEFCDRTGMKVELRIETLDTSPYILSDALMLTEAFRNLLDNALKYAGRGQPITVRLDFQGDKAVLTVEDRGPGIPPQERQGITERFVRGSQSGDTPGSGLGLSIVANVLRHHHATLAFGERDGGGLVVKMTFPLCGPPGGPVP